MVTAAQQLEHDTVNSECQQTCSIPLSQYSGNDALQQAHFKASAKWAQHFNLRLECCGWTKPVKTAKVGGRFIITFTKRPDVRFEFFKNQVIRQLARKVFNSGKYAFEHVATNAHCHAYVESPFNLCKSHFAHIEKVCGFVDIKRVGWNNGVEEYISKENDYVSFEN